MTIRLTWRRLLAGAIGLGLGGLLFVFSGLFNVAATGGHWAVTDWLLHGAMRSSVRTYSLLVEAPPPLDDRALQARGAGHYAEGCAPCHGAPGQPQNPAMQRSTPPPPDFSAGLDEWEPKELFRIVQHGVRYTGMPGWIAPDRHDEIWAMVALLEALPALSPQAYRALADGEMAGRPQGGQGVEAALADCARCHNRDGLGRDGAAFPRLAGLPEDYLLSSLRAFASGDRPSALMQLPVGGLDDAMLQALARHYAAQPAAPQPAGADVPPAMLEVGARIARDGLPAAQLPACLSCHGGAARARNPAWPRLDGQHAAYLEGQLALFRDGQRREPVMRAIGDRLTAGQARAVAAWFATQAETP
ncbi:c-type cytochrome [Roseomonas sp. 18066]|uniref:c-type cytochrome n=1 Tax=Roseomonas sp. 18066 TaxID=2681412 RepID=UPI00135B40BC|nr:c-type cytochrome [Roseomonas sp. 18066]